jgi:hypothetical protein
VIRRLGVVAVLALAAASSARDAHADDDSGGRLNVTLAVEPQVGLASAMVKVSGKTVALGDNPTVKISFLVDSRADHNDRARTVVATANVDAKGDYTTTVRMDQPGVYVVKVTAPDGKGTGSSTFTLLDPPDLRDELDASFDKLYAEGLEKLVASLRSQIAGIPANPARLQTEEKLNVVEKKMKEWPEQSKKLKAAVDKFQEIPKKYPETAPLLQPRLQRLADVVGENKAEQAVIEQELAKSRAASATCEKLEQVIEGLKTVSAALNFVQDGLNKVVVAFKLDGATDRFPAFVLPKSLSSNPAAAFAVKEASKLAVNFMLGPVGWADALVGFTADVSGYLAEQNFAKYCEKLEGPMKATMHAEFKQENALWWSYDIALEGKLILRYAKGAAPGAAVHVNGEFIGSATRFGVWENALAVLYPVTAKTSTLLRKLVVPPGFAYYDTEGKAVGGASPTGFNVAVDGDLVGSKLTLRLGDARSDFSDLVEAHVTYVLIGPMILAPIIVKYDLPFAKAHLLLLRAMNDGPVEIPVAVNTKTMTLARNLTRKRPAQGNVVDYTLNIRACNPGCK